MVPYAIRGTMRIRVKPKIEPFDEFANKSQNAKNPANLHLLILKALAIFG